METGHRKPEDSIFQERSIKIKEHQLRKVGFSEAWGTGRMNAMERIYKNTVTQINLDAF